MSLLSTWHCVVATLCVATTLCAQPVRPLPSAKVYGALQKLRSVTSVLYVAAHPDDENTRLLSWLATGKNIRTGYLSITRGDGGQNIIGAEQGKALGLIRTYELLEARKLDGAEQYFARAIDFGFSKNPRETFRQWDSLQLIADVVRTIRQFRPDVVICRFPKDSMAGHGQHSASAILTERAFEYINGTLEASAADHETITQLLEGTTEWKPTTLLFNAFRFGNRSTVREGMFALSVGQYDPLIGMGYGELAGISRSIHRSQGAGTPSTPGVQPEYFGTIYGPEPRNSLFDGIDTTWSRLGRSDIGAAIDSAITAFSFHRPHQILGTLLRIRRMISGIVDVHWRQQKLAQIDAVIVSCMGLYADITTPAALALAGDSLRTTLRVTTRSGTAVRSIHVTWPDGTQRTISDVAPDSLAVLDVPMQIPENTPVTQPYWLAEDATGTLFQYNNTPLANRDKPDLPSALYATMKIVFDADTLSVRVPISSKKLDPLRGDVIEALRIVPHVSVEPLRPVEVSGSAQIRLRAYRPFANGTFSLRDARGKETTITGLSLGANTDTLLTVQIPRDAGSTLTAELRIDNAVFNRQVKVVAYDHLPSLQYTVPAVVTTADARGVQITAKRVAYIAGAGEYAPEFLRGLGVVVDEIDDATILRTAELLRYNAVVVGIRAINTRKSMLYLMPSLMSYVEQGGTLVMQYNTLQDMSTKQLGPYPLTLSSKRVTEEDAPVTILAPEHPLLQRPNRITAEDFSHWVQERGLYYPVEYDKRYEALLSMHDENETPLTGALLYAKVGKGHYISCSLSLFRQLPAGVSGAMRLFANLVSAK